MPEPSGAHRHSATSGTTARLSQEKRRFDAILSVQALDLKPARRAVEEVLAAEAKRWQIDEITPKKSGKTVLKYVIRLDPDKQPELVLDSLLSRGAPHVVGATLR